MNNLEQLKRAAEYFLIYLRKSRQDNESETVEEVLARHEWQLQEFAVKVTGHKIPEENIYREIVSGETIKDRPEINKVLKRIEDPLCKGVIVIEPQRLTRGDLIDCGTMMQALQYTDTKVLTPPKTFDLTNEYDREFFERELLRGKDYVEYTKKVLMRGREASAKEGNWISSIAPYGYDRVKLDKGWTLAINEKEAELVRMIFHLYVDEEMGATAISHKLNELGAKPRMSDRFAQTAIRQILTNEVYIGKVRWQAKPVVKVFEDGKVVKKRVRNKDYELIDGKHKAIISDELFQQAQERKGKVTREKVDTDLKNIYAGLIKCKKCGGAIAMRIHRNKKGEVIRRDRYYCRTGIYCDNMSSNAKVVQNAILKALKEYLEDFKVKISGDNKKNVMMHQNVLKSLEDELEKLEKRQIELYDFLESGIYTKDVFLMRNEKLAEERERLQEQIKKARQDMPSIEQYEQQYYSLFEAINAIENPHINAKTKNRLLKNVVEVIYYEKDVSDKTSPKGNDTDASNVKLEIVLK